MLHIYIYMTDYTITIWKVDWHRHSLLAFRLASPWSKDILLVLLWLFQWLAAISFVYCHLRFIIVAFCHYSIKYFFSNNITKWFYNQIKINGYMQLILCNIEFEYIHLCRELITSLVINLFALMIVQDILSGNKIKRLISRDNLIDSLLSTWMLSVTIRWTH